ncbi:MAG: hypothetical protein KJ646_01035 [Nanoarchaeota archaeon]|nr:hypothetical protein [Nanoarchaeota archaeon]MBU4116620.1 hypothetical protein [Nanoarchaeota archaeon]
MKGLNTLLESKVGQYKAIMDSKSFPIAEVIEEVLDEVGIEFQNFPAGGGFDVRLTRGYEITLPKDFIGKEIPLAYFAGRISERYFSKYEPKVIKARPDLVEPSMLTENLIEWIVSSPEKESNNYAFIDVASVRVRSKPTEKTDAQSLDKSESYLCKLIPWLKKPLSIF